MGELCWNASIDSVHSSISNTDTWNSFIPSLAIFYFAGGVCLRTVLGSFCAAICNIVGSLG